MAKLTFIAIFLLFFFSLSQARISSDIHIIHNVMSKMVAHQLPIGQFQHFWSEFDNDPIDDSDFTAFHQVNSHPRDKREFTSSVPVRRCRHGHIISMNGDLIISGSIAHSSMIHHNHHNHNQIDDEIQKFRIFKDHIFAKDKHQRIYHHENESESKKEGEKKSQNGDFVNRIRKFLIGK